ncbi:2Fe-2S iron-sulfur cluster-binding protein [Oceanobacter kriegii]|uniref:2Fe-2S iron-sulfur cluster-binding protein n=1 Tax=Oceanobacter kriegii TaxID=64972 RepID=UPI000400BC16|nr:2Fe-2S iron-sulfur cluster-binding protein [Oceanobacter kriegii]
MSTASVSSLPYATAGHMGQQRLPEPMGLMLDRKHTVEFQFEGQTIRGYQGDTIGSALLANNFWMWSRSFKYHRPRGPLTMAGHDANSLVQLPSEPNVLADRISAASDMVVTAQNVNGSLAKDKDAILNHFGRFMPVGFYYKAFYKPKGIWEWWEKKIREKAGLGIADLDFKPEYYDKQFLHHDLVVVGAGPAGMSAALKAADGGANVLLLEENPILGGALAYADFDDVSDPEALRRELIHRIQSHANISVMTNAVCNAWFADNWLPVLQGKRLFKVRSKQCIMATGSYEQHVVFRGNDIPGVVMSSAAMRMMKLYAVKPGNNAVVLTGNDDGYLTALALHAQGVKVKALIDMRESRASRANSPLTKQVEQAGIPIRTGYTVYEALGHQHLEGVDVRLITGKGEVAPVGDTIRCDLLCMSAGYMPAYQLLCQAGGQLSYDDQRAEFNISNLPDNLHIAGSVNAKHAIKQVIADGEQAAIKALRLLGLNDAVEQPVECGKLVNFEWPIFKHPKGKDFVDFDEDLQAKDIINATRMGYRDVQLVKRFSTVGMGPSQGRHSALPTARLVAKATDRNVTETGVTTARPPFTPEKLAYMAGRNFDPYRQTAMHHRHVELGAKMIPAGVWARPGFYPPAGQLLTGPEGSPLNPKAKAIRNACIEAESLHVRSKVGLIDVSTLGGIEVRGPDAAELMNRIYTFGFLKQPVGKTRYAILTSDQGVVVDDGVACRFADDHYYVTATTSGVDAVYRLMTFWNTQWHLQVDITNVSTAFAAVNLAGPDSRKVLEQLTDLDLSPEGFPYLACREGSIKVPAKNGQPERSIPARLLRVGFVGELGYEIHVPTRYGEALWDLLMDAGQPFDIKPFGVETQRLLRLEKGHIIISQDTDGMSHPGELDLGWAVSNKKPYFNGKRAVDIVMKRPQSRKLVGFKLPSSVVGKGTKPEEGHIVLAENLAGADITGNVTSCEYSPTVDAVIGMAYVGYGVKGDQSQPGSLIPIRVDGGQMVMAEVVELPFFDKEQKRQEM